jgi:predicted NBD/HSP70 family sugar kinase
VIVSGELVRGAFGHAGEIGHLLVDPAGPLCDCGNRGCLEAYVGQARLLERAGIQRPHLLASEAAASLLARAEGQDARTLVTLDEAGRALGTAVSAVVNILDPEAIVLGGLFAPLAPWLADPITAVLHERVLASAWSPTRIISSILGTESALRGAAATGLRAALAEPWTVPERRAALEEARGEPVFVASLGG